MDDGGIVGQNLFLSSDAPSGTYVSNCWYSEVQNYD